MKVCYLVVLLFLITMAQRAGAINYESNSSNSNFANVSGPRVRSSKNDNEFVIHQIHHIFFLVDWIFCKRSDQNYVRAH